MHVPASEDSSIVYRPSSPMGMPGRRGGSPASRRVHFNDEGGEDAGSGALPIRREQLPSLIVPHPTHSNPQETSHHQRRQLDYQHHVRDYPDVSRQTHSFVSGQQSLNEHTPEQAPRQERLATSESSDEVKELKELCRVQALQVCVCP